MARMLVWTILGFFALELCVLVMAGAHVGVLATMGLLLLSCAVGLFLLRVYGLSMSTKMHQDLMRGLLPKNPLVSGLCLTLAAFLFMFPGFVSDFIALLLLLPALRQRLPSLLFSRARGGRATTAPARTGYMDEHGRIVWQDDSGTPWRTNEPPHPRGSVIIDCDAKDVTGQTKKE